MARVILILAIVAAAQCTTINLTCEHIQAFVDGHNSRRLLVAQGRVNNQPPAKEMKKIVWDPELQAKAENWAARNQFSHNSDVTIPSGRFTTGDSLYQIMTTNETAVPNPDDVIKTWFNEHQNYQYKPLSDSDFTSQDPVGHYTQVVWSDSVYVGCGVSKSTIQSGGYIWYIYLVVCNYGPAGNYIGIAPYEASQKPVKALTCGIQDCSKPYGPSCSSAAALQLFLGGAKMKNAAPLYLFLSSWIIRYISLL